MSRSFNTAAQNILRSVMLPAELEVGLTRMANQQKTSTNAVIVEALTTWMGSNQKVENHSKMPVRVAGHHAASGR